ncbi:antibiotic hydrolase [Longimycelium tulufanense]|uniref:Antibiotic hydrolase n=1 Tax=Longimycelium tulufanense TaxID=907463 RepID=A0A8J3FWB1_9PSEU|nr:antibiotic hydrolase [Longimycelium tulufanense]
MHGPDGVRLAVTVVRPVTPDRLPVLVNRTPYGRHEHLAEARAWARLGFACVLGDVRGRFDSTGDFHPYRYEGVDGAAILRWVHEQDFCDGRVILAGASYGAHCAITTALADVAPVTGLILSVPALGYGATAREPGGAARLACRIGWWAEHGGARRPRRPTPRTTDLLARVPIRSTMEWLLGTNPPGWDDLWKAGTRDPLWSELSRLDIPLLLVGGVHDPFAQQTLELAKVWRGPVRLVLGPWGHGLDSEAPGRALGGRRLGALYATWTEALCVGRLTGRRSWIAVDGQGQWRRWWPGSGVERNTRVTIEQDSFRAAPGDPFRSRRPRADLRSDAARQDRALFRTPPLTSGELRGALAARLRVIADAVDADWVLRVSAELPGGAMPQLGHAIQRVQHVPEQPTDITLTVGPLGTVLPTGSRLRFELAGHHWPRHARNPHTGVDPVDAVDLRPSRRRLLDATVWLPWWEQGADAVPAAALIEEVTQ